MKYTKYVSEPFQEGTSKYLFEYPWIGYTFGTLFIILGILLFFKYPKAKENRDSYRRRQLIEYKKNNPASKHKTYEQTRLYLPLWEKVKFMLPIFMGVLLICLGGAWILGQSIQSL